MKNRKQSRKEQGGDQGDIRAGGVLDGLAGFLQGLGNLAEAGERLSRQRRNRDTGENDADAGRHAPGAGGSFERILNGLTDLADKLGELSAKGDALSKTGEFTIPGKGKGIKGVYGFSLKTGLGEQQDGIKVEPFGNIRKDRETGRTVVQEIREPLVDVFAEEDHTLLVAEMPGISTKDIRLEVRDDVLEIIAEKEDKKYRKEVLLPHKTTKSKLRMRCNNGIVEIRCPKETTKNQE